MKIKRILGICECPGCLKRAKAVFKLQNKNTGKIFYAAVCDDHAWEIYEGNYDG